MSSHSRTKDKAASKKPKSSGKREHKCHICNRVFSRSDNLRTHQRLHSGEKPFNCKYCGQSFRWVGAVRSHEARHLRDGHSVSNPSPGDKRRSSSQHSKHASRHHGSSSGGLIVTEEDLIGDIEVDGPWHDVLDDGN